MHAQPQSINGFTDAELEHLYSLTGCSDPGLLRLDDSLLARMHPEWFPTGLSKIFAWVTRSLGRIDPIELIRWQLLLGDRSPAIVVSEFPFHVAAYSEELDCVAMLEFDPTNVPAEFKSVGTRLTTLNFDYSIQYGSLAADLRPGPDNTNDWTNFLPLIGELLSSETERMSQLKDSVPDSWWERVREMADAYDYTNGIRDGRPGFAAQPSVGQHVWRLADRGN